jgi:hypothetical protein
MGDALHLGLLSGLGETGFPASWFPATRRWRALATAQPPLHNSGCLHARPMSPATISFDVLLLCLHAGAGGALGILYRQGKIRAACISAGREAVSVGQPRLGRMM